MLWVTIILAIIQALPSLIKLIQEIFGAMDGQPLGTRLKMQHELQAHLLDWHHGGGDKRLYDALHAMGHGLGCASAIPPEPPSPSAA